MKTTTTTTRFEITVNQYAPGCMTRDDVARLALIARPFISTDNGKTGFPSFNLLAGPSDMPYTGSIPYTARVELRSCSGTCGCNNCTGCYAENMTRYKACFEHYAENTILSRTPAGRLAIYRAVVEYCHKYKPEFFRAHDSGDFDSLEYLVIWDCIVRDCPDTRFYCYTKRLDLFRHFMIRFGRAPRIHTNFSTWPDVCSVMDIDGAGYPDAPLFEFDDGTRPDLENVPHCPAVSKDGKRTGVTCNQCLHCPTSKPGSRWAVYKH